MTIVRGEPRLRSEPRPAYIDAEIEAVRRRRFQKAMALKDELGMLDEERYELARMLPTVDKDYGGSWKELNPRQLSDLITMMEGFIFISAMVMQRVEQE